MFVSFTTVQLICSVPAVIGAVAALPFLHTRLVAASDRACRTSFTRRRCWWCVRTERESKTIPSKHSAEVFKRFRMKSGATGTLLSSLGGTHMEEHSLETPAGRWLRPLSGPGSAASETGSEKMRGHGRGRWSPPSRLAHWWPQDATPQPPQSPGEGWRPTRVLGPDRPGLRTQATTGQAHMSHLSRKQRSQKHGRYLNPRGNI